LAPGEFLKISEEEGRWIHVFGLFGCIKGDGDHCAEPNQAEHPVDIRNEPHVTITDKYTKAGEHVSSECRTASGQLIWSEGPNPNKNVVFISGLREVPWQSR